MKYLKKARSHCVIVNFNVAARMDINSAKVVISKMKHNWAIDDYLVCVENASAGNSAINQGVVMVQGQFETML